MQSLDTIYRTTIIWSQKWWCKHWSPNVATIALVTLLFFQPHISLLFSYQMVCYYMPLEISFRRLSTGTNPIFPRLEMQKLFSKYTIFHTYFSNISVVFLSNNILLYTVRKLFLIPIQWCYSHIPMVRNAKAIFKIHHFVMFNSLTFVSTNAPTQI